MRREALAIVLLATLAAAGCKSVDDWDGLRRRGDTTPVELTDDGAIVASYLATLERLGRAGDAEQAEILAQARAEYLSDPSTRKRLNYAFVLAVPGHAASDAVGARALIAEALASPETMLPSERALAEVMVRDLDARLALERENEALRSGGNSTDQERIADLNRRLQEESAEKERLRRALQQAEAKLEAIATLEGASEPRR